MRWARVPCGDAPSPARARDLILEVMGGGATQVLCDLAEVPSVSTGHRAWNGQDPDRETRAQGRAVPGQAAWRSRSRGPRSSAQGCHELVTSHNLGDGGQGGGADAAQDGHGACRPPCSCFFSGRWLLLREFVSRARGACSQEKQTGGMGAAAVNECLSESQWPEHGFLPSF